MFNKVSSYKNKHLSATEKIEVFYKDYSNGALEGINNKIKVIKRVSYGYRRFENLRKRVLISKGIIAMKIPDVS